MRNSMFSFVLLSLYLAVFYCSGWCRTGNIVYGGWKDIFVIDMTAGKVITKIPIESHINDLELTGGGKLIAASRKGLHIVDTSSMKVEQTLSMGIVDAVEHDAVRNLTYVLQHPGKDPNESKGPHRLVKLSGDDFRELGSVELEPWIYDMFLSPDGNSIYVTMMAGRMIIKVDAVSFAEPERLYFGKGEMWEGRMVMLRHLTFADDGSIMYALEQGESDSTCLWNYSTGTSEMKRSCLEKEALVQGITLSADGSRIFANGVSEFIILDSDGKEISRTGLDVEHRWLALSRDSSCVYLTASTGEHEGRITCVDMEGKVIREVMILTPLNSIAVDGS